MRGIREYNLRVGGFFLLDIIKWERAYGRMCSRVEVAFFFLAVHDKLKNPEVGHVVGANGLICHISALILRRGIETGGWDDLP